MLLDLSIHLFKQLRIIVQEAIWEERLRLKRAGVFTYQHRIYDTKGVFDRLRSGYVNLKVTEINWLRVFKRIIQVLWKEYKSFGIREHISLAISIVSIYLFCINILDSIRLFYTAFRCKVAILQGLNLPQHMWFQAEPFIREIEVLYFLHELQVFLIVVFWKILFGILMVLPVLLIIAYSTLLERKVLSAAQRRRGPNKVGVKGSTQPLIDGIKLILKEIIIPVQSENRIFVLSSIWSIFFMLLLWFVIPTSRYGNIIQFNYELLALFCISVLGSISILLAGWSSNSKYAFLGGVRAGAQMISYELVLGLIVLIVMTVTSTTQILDIVDFQRVNGPLFLYLPAETGLFLILIVAETNRAPFDFAEAESELVSGYNTEYSGLPFAFFFIAEYGNILYMSLLTVLLFFGGWNTNFIPFVEVDNFFLESFVLFFKTVLVYFFFLWLWAALPRYRYDQLMSVCWKIFLPLVLLSLIIWILMFITLN